MVKLEIVKQWFDRQVKTRFRMEFRERLEIAGKYLQDRTRQNISVPVTRGVTGSVTGRSKPGEFPRKDSGALVDSIYMEIIEGEDGQEFVVGTDLDYGMILETDPSLNRGFLRRTLNEEQKEITRILTGPMK